VKGDLPFFEHDNDALSHPKMQSLLGRYGFEGYGRFWALNERIASSTMAILDLSAKVARNGLAAQLRMTTAQLDEFLTFLADKEECGLINYDGGRITTDRTQKTFEQVQKGRDSAYERKTGKPRENGGLPEKQKSSAEKPKSSPELSKNKQTTKQPNKGFLVVPVDNSSSTHELKASDPDLDRPFGSDDDFHTQPTTGKDFVADAVAIRNAKQKPVEPENIWPTGEASLDDYTAHLEQSG